MTADFDFTEPNNAALVVPVLEPHGSLVSPIVIEANVGILLLNVARELQFVIGDGPTNVTANPQIAPGSFVGQELILHGTSDINFVELHKGNGLLLNGICVLERNSTLHLLWDGISWVEIQRNDA